MSARLHRSNIGRSTVNAKRARRTTKTTILIHLNFRFIYFIINSYTKLGFK
jgi:hypothetical protein